MKGDNVVFVGEEIKETGEGRQTGAQTESNVFSHQSSLISQTDTLALQRETGESEGDRQIKRERVTST